MTTRPRHALLCLVTGCALAVAPAAEMQRSSEPALPVTVAGVSVAIDPATGKLTPPSREQVAALGDALQKEFARRGERREPVRRADGTLSLIVADRDVHYSIARIDDAGALALDCVVPGRGLESNEPGSR